MQTRLRLLVELESVRQSHTLKSLTSRVKTILKPLVIRNDIPETLVQNIITALQESFLSNGIQTISSYPIVREELMRVVSKDFIDNDDLVLNIIETLVS